MLVISGVFPLVVIVNIARGLCSLDVGPILIHKLKESKEALSVSENRGPKMGHKGRMALPPVFHTCSGKLIPYFCPRLRALSAVGQSSAKRPIRPWRCHPSLGVKA